ncbi:hypothetical protein E4U11_008334 [Claviceps purpurea]|nr:hypothetical protein E4U11_008334 [Claviceps purpurea]
MSAVLRVTIFEALGKLDHAVKSAEWILELAPRLPDGYIRLGDLAQLQKNDEYACELYAAGVEVSKETTANLSPKSQHPYTLYRHVLRQDPLRLPAEIVSQIFSYLSWIEIILVLRVSKEWTRKLTSPVHRKLWRNIVFPYNRYMRPSPMLSPDHLNKILSWAGEGGARKIVIDNVWAVAESIVTQLLESSPNLEHLGLHLISKQTLPVHQNKWTQLRHVSLSCDIAYFDRTEVDRTGGLPQTFLQNAASSLEHLNLVGIPWSWYRGKVPHFPQVKTLQIGSDSEDNILFPIFYLSIGFPRLEQLRTGPGLPYLDDESAMIEHKKWEDVWPHLKVFRYDPSQEEKGGFEAIRTRETLRYLTSLHSLQHIFLAVGKVDWGCMFPDKEEYVLRRFDVTQHSHFRNLRSFETPSLVITPAGGRILLSNAVMAKQLTSFDLVFSKGIRESVIVPDDSLTGTTRKTIYRDSRNAIMEKNSIWHLKGYEWLCGTPSIHTLGLYEFCFPVDAESDEDSPLLRFLATFPNLRTLKINSSKYSAPEFVSLVVSIMRVTHLKTIYTTCVDGEFLDKLSETAQEHGAQLMSQFPE